MLCTFFNCGSVALSMIIPDRCGSRSRRVSWKRSGYVGVGGCSSGCSLVHRQALCEIIYAVATSAEGCVFRRIDIGTVEHRSIYVLKESYPSPHLSLLMYELLAASENAYLFFVVLHLPAFRSHRILRYLQHSCYPPVWNDC